jgi:hypothetical protein
MRGQQQRAFPLLAIYQMTTEPKAIATALHVQTTTPIPKKYRLPREILQLISNIPTERPRNNKSEMTEWYNNGIHQTYCWWRSNRRNVYVLGIVITTYDLQHSGYYDTRECLYIVRLACDTSKVTYTKTTIMQHPTIFRKPGRTVKKNKHHLWENTYKW